MRSKGVISSAVLLGAVVVICAVVLVMTGHVSFPTFGGGGDEQAVTVSGTVVLAPAAFGPDDGTGHCGGVAGYGDVATGGSVVVHDADGKTIGTGTLGVSVPGDFFDSDGEQVPASCGFPFSIPAVPSADFYGIAVGHRNTVTFTRAQVEAGQVKLTLGS